MKITFRKMGMDIDKSVFDYTGDIGNYRVRAEFENESGVRFFVEIQSVGICRRHSLVTGKPLKKIIRISDTNGMMIDIDALYSKPIKGCTGNYFMHEEALTLYHACLDENPCHTKDRALGFIRRYTGINFDEMEII